ncbi:MAG: hypothetical protein ACK44N_08430, partial [Bacteroidota bacterium]
YILNRNFGSREVKNNLGVCLAMQGLSLSGDPWKNLIFPFVLDPFSRTADGVRSFATEDSIKATFYFKQAEQYFTEATSLDKLYYPAYINLAIVKVLIGKQKTAFRILDQTEEDFSSDIEAMKQCKYTRAVIAYALNQSKLELEVLSRTGDIRASICLQQILMNEANVLDNYQLPSSSIASDLQPFIRKSTYSIKQQQRIRLNGQSADIWSRDTLGMQLIILNVVKPYNKIYQIIQCNSKQVWPEGIPDALNNSVPNAIFNYGPITIEKRRSQEMNFYLMLQDGKEIRSWVIY